MTTMEFLERLDGVKSRGAGRWRAQCPAHDDRRPSLSIQETDDKILLHCFGGCSASEIVEALGLRISALFYGPASDPRQAAQAAAIRRGQDRRRREIVQRADGFTIDVLREAERFISSRAGINIESWSDAELDTELNALADAYSVLEVEHGR
jgi:hypothetical protein